MDDGVDVGDRFVESDIGILQGGPGDVGEYVFVGGCHKVVVWYSMVSLGHYLW